MPVSVFMEEYAVVDALNSFTMKHAYNSLLYSSVRKGHIFHKYSIKSYSNILFIENLIMMPAFV